MLKGCANADEVSGLDILRHVSLLWSIVQVNLSWDHEKRADPLSKVHKSIERLGKSKVQAFVLRHRCSS